ncbi:MAG: T9SS type A sorting domain-containing protein, partial [Bacteroidota bacterium]
SATITAPLAIGVDTITVRVVSGSDTVRIFWKRVVRYVSATSVDGSSALIPNELVLLQNYPNPFNPSTVIRYGVPRDGHVTLSVIDVLGRTVRTLVVEFVEAGYHQINFDVTGIPSGVYFYRLEAGNATRVQKLVVLR